MPSSSRTPRNVPDQAVADHWQSPGHDSASGVLPLFSATGSGRRYARERQLAEYNSRREQVTDSLYQLRQQITARLKGHQPIDPGVKQSIGIDALVELLDEKPTYGSNVSRCLNRSEENRRAQIDWDAPALLDADLFIDLIKGMTEIASSVHGVAVTVTVETTDKPSEEEIQKAALATLRDLERNAGINASDLLNRKLGRRPGTVKL